jgi:hypothetical protein
MIGAETLVGSCNTQLSDKFVAPLEAGIDTWRLVRYLDNDRDLQRALSLCEDAGRGLALCPKRPRDHVVGVLPSHRMLWIEGHPAVEGLAHPSALPEAALDVLDHVEDFGFPLGRDAGLGRCDGTVTLGFEEQSQGIAVLQGVAALDFPRSMPVVYGRPPQTVYIAGEKSAERKARIYDKGVETATAAPGLHVRFENQARYTKETRRLVEEHDLDHVRNRYNARFGPLAKAAQGVTVASMPVLAAEVADRVAAGDLRLQQAERMLGFMLLHQAGQRRGMHVRTVQRRRRELREQGYVLADDFYEPVSVNLGDTLEAALEAWSGG